MMTCGAEEENVHNNRLMARRWPPRATPPSCTRCPTCTTTPAGATRFDPHLTGLLAAAVGRRGERRRRLRALGPPGAGVPGRARRRRRVRAPRDGRRGRRPARGRPREALLRRLVRRRVVVEPRRSRSRSAPAATSVYESWILDQVVPFIRDDCGGAAEVITCGVQPRRLPRRQLRAQARRRVPARDLHVGQLRPRRLGRLGRARRRPPTSTTRWTTSPTSAATTSTGCARSSACCWSAGRGSGRTRPARSSPPAGSPALLQSKGIRCELDLWGYDVAHDWPSWRAQLAHHLPRFC